MSRIRLFVCMLLLTTVIGSLTALSNPSTLVAPTDIATTVPPSGDKAADLVVSFYKVLLQDGPATMQQEKDLFTPTSVVRRFLVLGNGDPRDAKDVEPMHRTAEDRARFAQQDAKVAAAGPVVLNYFRKHKDWFFPIAMKSPNEINVSSLSQFVRTLDHMKNPCKPGNGFVLAVFVHDRSAEPGQIRMRTIVFMFEDGKIDPDGIKLEGFDGRNSDSVLSKCLAE